MISLATAVFSRNGTIWRRILRLELDLGLGLGLGIGLRLGLGLEFGTNNFLRTAEPKHRRQKVLYPPFQ